MQNLNRSIQSSPTGPGANLLGEFDHVLAERRGSCGLLTLMRPKALNALTLPMVRRLLQCLRAWQDDPAIAAVAIRGSNKTGQPGSPEALFGGFCAGGDIRFFHQAATSGNDSDQTDLAAFFTEEYTLNHLIATYSKPYVAFMDGIVMGGGMGISQGASLRIVTEHSKLAMPETGIGLFPDVGGGFFLSRCPGHVGEYLALTGHVMNADEAIAWGLADTRWDAAQLPGLWDSLACQSFATAVEAQTWIDAHLGQKSAMHLIAARAGVSGSAARLDTYFGHSDMQKIMAALESDAALGNEFAQLTAAFLRKRSPLMLQVTLELIRRARNLPTLADDLRLERTLVYHCFARRPGGLPSETVEGIRALAIDKDHAPRWNPARLEAVTAEMMRAFFASPWAADQHPLQKLGMSQADDLL